MTYITTSSPDKYRPEPKQKGQGGTPVNVPPGLNVYTNQQKLDASGDMQVAPEWAKAWISQFNLPNQSYFAQDPTRLAKYHFFGAGAPAEWQSPDWFDRQKYADAFNFMTKTQGNDWTKWKPFDPDDPAGIYLTSLPQPPKEFMLPGELSTSEELLNFISGMPMDENGLLDVNNLPQSEYDKLMKMMYGDEQREPSPFMQQGKWNELENWQKWALSALSPQPMEGRPEATRLTAAGFQGAQAAMGALAVTKMLVGVGATAGVALGPWGSVIGAVAGLTVGGAAAYQAYTGTEIWGLNTVLRALDLPDELFEKVIGVGVQMARQEDREVLENLEPAWRAGQFAYESSPVGNWVLNFMSGTWQSLENTLNKLPNVEVELSSGQKASWKAGQIWALEKAITEPVLVRGGLLGGAALDEARSMIASAEDINEIHEIYADFTDRFGYSGNVGDFLLQSVLDPIQGAPWLANQVMGKIAKATGNVKLDAAVRATRGYLDADILPWGVQDLYTGITKRQGTKGIFDTLATYKNYIRHGTLPEGLWPTQTIDVPKALYETNPTIFDGSAQDIVAAFKNNVVSFEDGRVKNYNMEGVNNDIRAYIEGQLTQSGVDIGDQNIKALIDNAIAHVREPMDNVTLNTKGTTDAEYQIELGKAYEQYFNEKISSMIEVGTKGIELRYYPEITPWERKFAGLTDSMQFAEMQPGQANTWFKKLTSLTPESQVALFLDMAHTNMAGIVGMYGSDPTATISLMKQAAKIDPIAVGKVGTALIESPAMNTVAPALKAFIESGKPDQLLAAYTATEGQRAALLTLADGLGVKPGELLDLIKTKPDTVIQMIRNSSETAQAGKLRAVIESVNSGLLTAETLSENMKVFWGENFVPWHPDMFNAELIGDMGKFMEGFLVDRYGIEPKPWLFRLSNALKSYQSLMVLGFNPIYAVNNYVNNIFTRAAQGVFGFMTPGQIDMVWNRIGLTPAGFDKGIGPAADIAGTHKGGMAIAAAMDTGDFISQMHKVGQQASRLGLFSNIAAKIEVAESRQATTIGFLQMWDKTWKDGVGYSKMPGDVEATLRTIHPQLPERIYSLVNQGMNMDEISNALYTRGKFQGVESTLERAIQDVFTNSPEKAQDIIVKSGIKQELINSLEGAQSKSDINNAFDFIESRIDAIIEQSIANDILAIPEDVRNRIQSEGLVAAPQLWFDMWDMYATRMTKDLIDNQITAILADSYTDNKDYGMARQVWQARIAEADTQWKRTHTVMLATAQGLFDAIDINNPSTVEFVNVMGEWVTDWEKFYVEKNAELKAFYQSEARGDQRKSLWKATQDKIAKLYDQHTESGQKQLVKMFDELGRIYEDTSHRPAAEFTNLGQEVIKAWNQREAEIKKFRESIRNTDLNAAQKRQAFETFQTETLKPLIAQQRDLIAKGGMELWNNKPVTPPVEQPAVSIPTTPTVDTSPAARAEALRADIISRAARYGDDYVASPEQRAMLARMLSQVYKDADDRHIVQRYLFDTQSTKDVKGSKVKAALDLLISVTEEGSEYVIPENIRVQMEGLLEAARASEGQGSLYDGRPADNADPADKAKYHADDVKKRAQEAADQQAVKAEAVMKKADLQKALLDAGYKKQEVNALLTLIELRAKQAGEDADTWISKRIAAVIDSGNVETGTQILYQGGIPIPADPSLVALHSMTLEKLKKVFELGGMAAPSLAITTPDLANYGNFGEIIFVGNKNIIDPQADPRNLVYDADIYSPRTPPPVQNQSLDTTARDSIVKALTDIGAEVIDVDDAIGHAVYKYFEKLPHVTELEFAEEIIRNMGIEDVENYARKILNKPLLKKDEFSYKDLFTKAYQNSKDVYDRTVQDLASKFVLTENSIKVERQLRLPDYTYADYTLENITFAMNQFDDIRGKEGGVLGATRAYLTEQFTTLDQMRAAKNKLVDYSTLTDYITNMEQPAIDKAVQAINAENGYVDTITKGEFLRYVYDYAKEYGKDYSALEEYMIVNLVNSKDVLRWRDQGVSPFSPDTMDALRNTFQVIYDAPTQYFEAKPMRPVRFDEWSGVLIPTTTPESIKTALDQKGIKYMEYEQNQSTSRVEAVENFAKQYDTLFQDERGSISFQNDGRAIINLFKNKDVSTMVHEVAHIFRRDLSPEDLNVFAEWAGLKQIDEGFSAGSELVRLQRLWDAGFVNEGSPDYDTYMAIEEKFADGFEKYLRDELAMDVAPPALIRVFQQFAQWLRDIYKSIVGTNLDIEISPEMKRVYDKLFFDEQVIDHRQTMAQKLKHAPAGDTTIAIGVDTHQNYDVQFRIVEAADLITSHDPNFKQNSLYPQELQARFRDRAANQQQILRIISEFNPDEILVDTRLTDAGTPIIGPDMVVESGNGRVIALKTMAEKYPDQWQMYLDGMNKYLADYGFAPDALEGMQYPVLVRERLSDVDRVSFALDANADRTGGFSSMEQAFIDTGKWSNEMLANFKVGEGQEVFDAIQSPTNADIVNRFLQNVPQNELSEFIDANDNLSRQGLERIKNSLLAKVFDTESGRRVLELFGESADPLVRNIERAIERSLGDLAALEALIDDGRRPGEYSISSDIADAINAYLLMKNSGQTLEDWNNTISMFNSDRYIDIDLYTADTPQTTMDYKQELFHFLVVNRRSISPLAAFIKQYVSSILGQPEMDQMSLLGDISRPAKESLAVQIMDNLVREKTSKSFLDHTRPGEEAQGPTLFQSRVVGETPLNGTPTPMFEGRVTEEAYTETLSPLLKQMREIALNDMESGTAFSLGDLPDDVADNVGQWLTTLPESMAGTKLASMQFGELMRNRALLNYQERYGIDDYMQIVFPYQFWYTRSIGEWAKRMIEKPAWFSMYARLRRHQERMEQEGIPARLKGKFRIPAPYLPEWMGGALYVDPLSQAFPFTQFSAPFEMMQQTGDNVHYAAVQKIQTYVKQGSLTAKQAQAVIESQEGPIWNMALAEAQSEMSQSGELTGMNLASMMLSPAMWWTYPYHMLKGTPEKLYPLPGTRTGQALKTLGGPLGVIGNILALPEETIRRKFNLSQFGEWGDYYIDRHLANMAAEGLISAKDAKLAMIERQGEAWDMAVERTEQEWALKIPGSQTAMAIQEGKLGGVLYTLPTTLFPAGLLPEGELIQRGLKYEYSKAWEDYKAGNPKAVNEFFNKHPEFQARLALFQEPEERLRQFLVSEIWERWGMLENKNKPLVVEQLGEGFEQMFLDKNTRDYTAIDHETLAYWARLLGGYVPQTEATAGQTNVPLHQQQNLKLYRPEVIAQVEEFQAMREQMFPNYKFLQTTYFDLPENPKKVRKDFLEQYPELKQYWNWKDEFYKQFPLVKAYQDDQSKRMNDGSEIFTTSFNQQMPSPEQMTVEMIGETQPALMMQLMFTLYAGQDISGGARTMLRSMWEAQGQPAGNFDAWLKLVMNQIVK
jgi:hypothetical protein